MDHFYFKFNLKILIYLDIVYSYKPRAGNPTEGCMDGDIFDNNRISHELSLHNYPSDNSCELCTYP